jgi:hypothetical protein
MAVEAAVPEVRHGYRGGTNHLKERHAPSKSSGDDVSYCLGLHCVCICVTKDQNSLERWTMDLDIRPRWNI